MIPLIAELLNEVWRYSPNDEVMEVNQRKDSIRGLLRNYGVGIHRDFLCVISYWTNWSSIRIMLFNS